MITKWLVCPPQDPCRELSRTGDRWGGAGEGLALHETYTCTGLGQIKQLYAQLMIKKHTLITNMKVLVYPFIIVAESVLFLCLFFSLCDKVTCIL